MPDISQLCSFTERRAEELERQALAIKKCEYMKNKIGKIFSGTIMDIKRFGIFVRLENSVEGMVSLYEMPDIFEYEDGNTSVTGEMTGESYRIGDTVSVRVAGVNIDERKINFKMVK